MSSALFDVLAIQGVAFPSVNISSEIIAGFEEKTGRNTMFLSITEATFATAAFVSLALGDSTQEITAAQAKRLPGVNEGETITLFCELFADDLSGGRAGSMAIDFYTEAGEQVGTTQAAALSAADAWEQKKLEITVPEDATRMNISLVAEVEPGETLKVWAAKLRVIR